MKELGTVITRGSTLNNRANLAAKFLWLTPQTPTPKSAKTHPVRHFWPSRNQRFFCSRLRSGLLVERLGPPPVRKINSKDTALLNARRAGNRGKSKRRLKTTTVFG
jgi:hypothetical protein